MEILLNGKRIIVDADDYASLHKVQRPEADTLIVNGRTKPWSTPITSGDEVLLFDSAVPPTKMLWHAIYDARYGSEIMHRLQAAHVAICGLGGLGSLVALELARLGVGRLLLIDGDSVDPTNLARQHYRIDQIGQAKTTALAQTISDSAPLTTVETASCWLTAENIPTLLSDWPFVCECLDRPDTKAMLTTTVLSTLPEHTLVTASGMAGHGSGNTIVAKKLLPNLYQVGDGKSEGEEGIGLMAPRVGLCASAQATLVMRLLLGETTP